MCVHRHQGERLAWLFGKYLVGHARNLPAAADSLG